MISITFCRHIGVRTSHQAEIAQKELIYLKKLCLPIHSVSEHKKRYIRNYTQILENLRNAIVVLFGLRNEFVNVQGNKKRNTQNIQVKKQQIFF